MGIRSFIKNVKFYFCSGANVQKSDKDSCPWILTDPVTYKSQQKLWENYLVVVETFDEKQVHIVKQVSEGTRAFVNSIFGVMMSGTKDKNRITYLVFQ